jgi:hypothetical protein
LEIDDGNSQMITQGLSFEEGKNGVDAKGLSGFTVNRV